VNRINRFCFSSLSHVSIHVKTHSVVLIWPWISWCM